MNRIYCFLRLFLIPMVVLAGLSSCETGKDNPDVAVSGVFTGSTEDFSVIRVGILGDSISTFEGQMCNSDYKEWYPKSDPNVGVSGKENIAVDSVEKIWWWRLINEYMSNGVLDANSSWSGTRVRGGVETEGYSGKKYQAGFVNRTDDFNDPDVIIIFGGTNDTTKDKGALLGDYEWDKPIEEHNVGEFRSAYVCMIKKLHKTYPGVQLILVIGDSLTKDYEDSIVEIADHFDLPYVNFVGDGAMLPKCRTVHPDATGHRYLAEKIFIACRSYLSFSVKSHASVKPE